MDNEPRCCNSWRSFIALCVVTAYALFPPLSPDALAEEARNERLRERLASGVLRWGGDAEGGAPFQFRDKNDAARVVGFEVEIADSLVEILSRIIGKPVRAEFVQYEWDNLTSGLLNKKDIDAILSGKEITEENSKHILFTRPYYVYTQQLVVRKDEDRIHRLADCRDRPVATLNGSEAKRVLENARVTQIVAHSGQVEPYLDLQNGRVDAVLMDMPIAAHYVKEMRDLKFAGKRMGRGEYGMGLRPEDTDLAEACNEALGEMMASGLLYKIYRKYEMWNEDQAQLARAPNLTAELAGLMGHAVREHRVVPLAQDTEEVDPNDAPRSAAAWTFDQYAPLLAWSAVMTVYLTVASMAVAMVIGLIVALCRMYGVQPVSWLALGYVEFFRGVPLLLLLTTLYFGLPTLGIQLSAVTVAILGFGLNYAAYEAEIYRSSILAVPVGQWEAGRALGMTDASTFRRIVFPQAFRTALGPMTNDFVAMFKDTSLVSSIAVVELTKQYNILARSSLQWVELGLLTAVLYLAMSVPLGYLSRYLEKRWSPGR